MNPRGLLSMPFGRPQGGPGSEQGFMRPPMQGGMPRHFPDTGYLPRPMQPGMSMNGPHHFADTGYMPRQVPQGGYQPTNPWMFNPSMY